MTSPKATYRLQLHKDFPIARAIELIPFLEKLGISDLYISPPFAARAGSRHGYDVIDPSRVNPEIGGDEQFAVLCEELAKRGMGLVVDIVPNHMAASCENRWWMDVLENGPLSKFAQYFDVEWSTHSGGWDDQILLPVLGDPFGTALERGDIRLGMGGGGFTISYYSITLPVDPRSYATIAGDAPADKQELRRRYESDGEFRARVDARIAQLNGRAGDAASFDGLEELLQRQPYRLAWWQNARERVNYRRFFDVSELIGVRQENREVFVATHRLICEWVRKGMVKGLRVDHVDGLFHPREYLARLGGECGARPYIVVEKILTGDETLPEEWTAEGSSGYDFLGMTNNLFVDGEGLKELGESYARFTGLDWTMEDAAYEQKRWIIRHLFRGETFAIGLHLGLLAELDRQARDLSPRESRKALLEVTACLAVYRTYIEDERVSERDAEAIGRAIEEAKRRNKETSAAVYDFVERVLLLRFPAGLAAEQRADWVRFVMRWQQLTGPIAAKGVEDTAYYLYNRLVSMNEVGGQREAVEADAFHRFQLMRRERWPASMNTLSTHDTKRSEDVRARLNVLSEIPGEWSRTVARWARWNRDRKAVANAPDANEEILLYQTMLGAWPFEEGGETQFVERLKAYMVKAAREAKVYSSWIKPDEAHEGAIHGFIDAILDPEASGRFLESFRELARKVAWYGALNSLSQTLIKLTAPGVPDTYQGTELWDFSLVDPDNRRPVDVDRRLELLREMDGWEADDLMESWRDGRVKAMTIQRALAHRLDGDYIPVRVEGDRAVVFARRQGERWTLTVVPRFATRLAGVERPPVGRRVWKDTAVELPGEAPRVWRNVFTGETTDGRAMAEVLRRFPVALLVG